MVVAVVDIFLCVFVYVLFSNSNMYVYSHPDTFWYSSTITKRIEERKVSTATDVIILRGTLDARLADKHGLNVVVFFFVRLIEMST